MLASDVMFRVLLSPKLPVQSVGQLIDHLLGNVIGYFDQITFIVQWVAYRR